MVIAIMDTGSYQFKTVSESEGTAKDNIRKAWSKHIKEVRGSFPHHIDLTPVSEIEDEYGIDITEINMDGVVRDETTLIVGGTNT